ncbi:protein phosphatase 1 regulatory subunit 12B isoform X2 [Frankliniella occidentalis]|uniref:Protein phosphatase 1 regulatory subunit 12B n=1 Tax=Frankliniella occidentalis TaxID=133901 RepID=A0A6J1SBL8_FRAOC|nr:protein phosphatase 1 regulatory subunit 12B isoform X2 [Frankliniella occidentalis]
MSIETRSSSALFKRAEQLKRWEESETNREDTVLKTKTRKIKFSAGCVFLAACASGDKEEVVRLLEKGADIDTANVDGLTALHQACIDDNLDMVEFLVEHGADVNRGDNEGWTPLHATASCGFISIAKYLIEHGANVAAVNNDGELPLDIAESDEMEELLLDHITTKEIDCDEARGEEERMMMMDAKEWINNGEMEDKPHPKTGASALHVAAAKGYIKVISVLLQGKVDINSQDCDGWTPLHAAAHWGQKEACEMLVEHFCDMEIKNYVGQTAFDVADLDMVRTLEELKKKQATLQRDNGDINAIINKKAAANTPKRRMSGSDKSSLVNKDTSSERQVLDRTISEEEGPPGTKVKKVEVKIEKEDIKEDSQVDEDESSSESDSEDDLSSKSDTSDSSFDKIEEGFEEKKNQVNRIADGPTNPAPSAPPKLSQGENESNMPSWRRPGSVRGRSEQNHNQIQPPPRNFTLRLGDNEVNSETSPAGGRGVTDNADVVLRVRRTQSFIETDDRFYRRYQELHARIKGSCPSLPSSQSVSALPTRSASLRERYLPSRRGSSEESKQSPTKSASAAVVSAVAAATAAATAANLMPPPADPVNRASQSTTANSIGIPPISQVRSGPKDSSSSGSPTTTPTTPTTPGGSKLSPGNIFKNFFKSFVPPVRDEESETQRKAHAKRVRETRRSTQGVTLEEIKSAEQLVKKKQQQQLHQATQQLNNDQPNAADLIYGNNCTSISATITTGEPTVPSPSREDVIVVSSERRPSWRLRVDNGDRSKFLLEDARNRSSVPEATTAYIRRPSGGSIGRPASAPSATPDPVSTETTVTLPLRRQIKPPEDKEQDKENDSRNAQATQAVIARRKRPKRRSTGVVHVDLDEIDPDRQEANQGEVDDSSTNHNESGAERSGRSSRLGSTSSAGGDSASVSRAVTPARSENGEIDYKKLYEESQLENERLREKLKKTEDDLRGSKALAENSVPNKNSLSEIEKRERRAMERKLSEMEEELKQLQKLKMENERLRSENRALTRVVTKLTSSANARI